MSSTNGEIRYRVHTPSDVPVGSYQCHVRVPLGKNKSKGERVWEDKKEIVFLFNPWNKGRHVHVLLIKYYYYYYINVGLINYSLLLMTTPPSIR